MEETLGCSNANAESRRLKVPMPYVKANDLASWLMNFKNARDINGLSDLESIAYAKDRLTGDAYVWAARCKETTWEGFEQKLTAKFVTPSQNVREAARAVLDFNVTQGTSDLDILNSFEDHYHHFIYMTTDDSPYRKIPNDFLLGPLANAFNDDSACIKLNGLAASSKNVDDIIREMRHYLQETRSRNGNGLAVQVSSLHDQLTLLTKKLDQMTTANQQPIPAMLSSQAPPIHQRPPPQGQNYSRTPYTPHKTGNCYNCQGRGHNASECPSTCKICHGQHVFYKCPDYQQAKARPHSSFLIMDAFAASKRHIQEDDDQHVQGSKRPHVDDTNNTISQEALPFPDMVDIMQEDLLEEPIDDAVPTEPMEKSPSDDIIDNLLNAKVHMLSTRQLYTLSPYFRRKVHESSTRSAHQSSMLNTDNGDACPFTMGFLDDKPCPVILDGGSTQNIISKAMAKLLGYKQVEKTDHSVLLANSMVVQPVGLLRNVKLTIGNKTISVDAMVFEGIAYDFLLGRRTFSKLSLSTNWGSHAWTIGNGQDMEEITVSYSHNPPTLAVPRSTNASEPPTNLSSGFLIMLEDANESTPLMNDTSRTGQLHDIIDNTQILDNTQADRMHAIVEKYSESFGIGYEHLKTTNVTKLHIDTGEAAPIYCKPYGGLSFQDLAILKDDLGQMVKHGIMQPTLYVTGEQANGWAFPCRYV